MAQEKPTAHSEPDASADATPAAAERMAEQALSDAEHAAQSLRDEAGAASGSPIDLPNFEDAAMSPGDQAKGLALLNDVDLKVKIELGRTHMYVDDVLKLNADAVIELDKAAGDPVDIFVNDRLVARGEVLVLNENFCVRVSEIIKQAGADGP